MREFENMKFQPEKDFEDILNNQKIKILSRNLWPPGLLEIPQPPKKLFIRGEIPQNHKFLCVVGPRKYSEYGERVCQKIISGLSGSPICIVSGLAIGIDSIAHLSALENSLPTIAFPGSGLSKEVLYPAQHRQLAAKILENKGALISEFSNDFGIQSWMFPQRNRLMAGISDATLIIEAVPKSGTMITARLTLDYNRNLLAIPGSIFNVNSIGTNNLIQQGAVPITSANDILEIFNFALNSKELLKSLSEKEKIILENLQGETSIETLLQKTKLPISELNEKLILLEINGLVQVINGKICQK